MTERELPGRLRSWLGRTAAVGVASLAVGCATTIDGGDAATSTDVTAATSSRSDLPPAGARGAELPAPELAEFSARKRELDAAVLQEAAGVNSDGEDYDALLSVWQRYFESLGVLVEQSTPADRQRHRVAQASSDRVVRLDTLVELGDADLSAASTERSQTGGLELASAMWLRIQRDGQVDAGPASLATLLREPLPEGMSLRVAEPLRIPGAQIGALELSLSGAVDCRAQVGWSRDQKGDIYHWRRLIAEGGEQALDLAGNHGLRPEERLNYVFLRHDGCQALAIRSLRLLRRAERFARDPFGVAYESLRNELRRVVYQHAGSELTFRFRVPERGPSFSTGLGRLPGGEAVSFQLELDDGGKTLLLDEAPKDGEWGDIEVDLARWAGREVRLRLRVHSLNGTGAAPGGDSAGVGFWANPVVRAEAIPLPDVVWYLVDCLRADHMGLYGYPLPTTPQMDAFFGQGAVFDRAYTNGNNTRSSVATLFTGLTPAAVGTDEPWGRVGDVHLTVPELLREMGYRTIGVVTNANGGGPAGLDQGYSELLELDWFFAMQDGTLSDGKPRFLPQMMEALEERLNRTSDVPIFLYVHTLDLHDPYRPPEGYEDHFALEDYAESERLWELDEDDLLQARRYDAELRYSDDVFERFLGVFERSLRWDDAIVWLTADHGEYLGEKGMWYHHPWFPPQDAVLRIPLAVVRRGHVPAVRLDAPAQLLDVGDTTLGLIGEPEGVRPWSLGRDLRPLFEGAAWPGRPIVSENEGSRDGGRTQAFRLDPFTFRQTPNGAWVTSAKPGVEPPGTASFSGVLEAYGDLSRSFDAYSSGQEPSALSPGEIDQLRALGYIE